MPAKRKNVLADPARLKKPLKLVDDLPEATVELAGEQHLALKVRKKTFAWFLDSHHDDGIICLCAKNKIPRQQELIAQNPDRYFSPQYVGHSGWVALHLDQPKVDWGEVLDLLLTAYRLQAPKELADQIG